MVVKGNWGLALGVEGRFGWREAYWRPMRDAVRRAMRMVSVEPLTLGVPRHRGIEGIFAPNYCIVGYRVVEKLVACVRSVAGVKETWRRALGVAVG
jgi:hypothetical protein